MEKLSKAARIAQILMGVIYLVAGAIKVWEPVLFYWEAIPYTQLLGMGQDSWPAAARSALLLGPLECVLGLALLLNWRPKVVFPVATLLMAAFLALMVHAWRIGASIDCGCFGALVERSPGEAAVEDAVMLGLLIFGWWGLRARTTPALAVAGKVVLAGLVLAVGLGSARFFPEADRLENSDLQAGVRLTGLSLQGTALDLSKGEYLVELMSPVCGHCINAMPKMNELAENADLPRIVALTSFGQDSMQLVEFKQRLNPRFDIATISKTDFFRLTWRHGYPRLAYVRDGIVQQVWERENMPELEELKNAIGAKG